MTRSEPQTVSFDAYVEARGGDLFWSAFLLTGDHQHAEDLVQTALSKTYQRFDLFDNNHHFESYVRTTMYRTFASWWRRRGSVECGPGSRRSPRSCA